MSLNDYTADKEKPGEICSATFVVDDFSGLFLCSYTFSLNIRNLHK